MSGKGGRRRGSKGDETSLERKRRKLEEDRANLEKEKANFEARKKKGNAHGFTTKIPTEFELVERMLDYVQDCIWPKVKFVADEDENYEICEEVMANVPGFQQLLEDEDMKPLYIRAFTQVHGGDICRKINDLRTGVASSMKKSVEKYYIANGKVPTTATLRDVIYRKNLHNPDEPSAGEFAKMTQQEKKKAQETKKKIIDNQEIGVWYIEALLPCVCSKNRWGHNIRNYTTISHGICPGSDDKYVTSSDEALVLATYENYRTRWIYTAKLKQEGVKNLTKAHKEHADYKTKWVKTKAGSKQYGGWELEGRVQFGQYRKKIAAKKKGSHVKKVELALLALLREKNGLTDKKKTPAGNEDKRMSYEGKIEARVAGLDFNSDDAEDSSESETEFDD